MGATARASGPGGGWPMATDLGPHALAVWQDRHQLPGAGDRLSWDCPAAVLERLGQGRQLQHRRTDRLDAALFERLWRATDRRSPGGSRIRGRGVVALAATAGDCFPPAHQG